MRTPRTLALVTLATGLSTLLAVARPARAQDTNNAQDMELPTPIPAASAPVKTGPPPNTKPDLWRWDAQGGIQGYFGSNPGVVGVAVQGEIQRVIFSHLDAGGGIGLVIGTGYESIPITLGLRFYPFVKNQVTGVLDATHGAKVRSMTSAGDPSKTFDTYLLLDTGFELAFIQQQNNSSSAFPWIIGLGFGVDYDTSNSSTIFGELRVQLNPGGYRYKGNSAIVGKFNALLVAAGYRF